MVCQALCGGGRKKPIYIIYKEKEKSSVLMQMLTGLFTLCKSPEILQGKIGLQFFDMLYYGTGVRLRADLTGHGHSTLFGRMA